MEEVETEILKNELVCEENATKCRCSEMEERCKKAEAKIVELELVIERRKEEYDALEAKFKELNAKKDAIEDENKGSDKEVKEENRVVDLTKDGKEEEGKDLVNQLMVENCVLDCEKKKAESDVKVWKEKFKELELWVSQVDESNTLEGLKEHLLKIIEGENRPQGRTSMEQPQIKEKSVDFVDLGAATAGSIPAKSIDDLATGTPNKSSPFSRTPLVSNKGVCLKSEGGHCQKARRHISFEEERSSSKKMVPSTPGSSRTACLNVIDIFDSDDESDIQFFKVSTPGDQKSRISKDHTVALKKTAHDQGKEECSDESDQFFKVSTPSDKKSRISKDHTVALKRTAHDQGKEECLEDCIDDIPCVPTPKRKRAAKIVNSDTESDDEDDDDDDNVPISKLKRTDIEVSIPDKVNGVVTRSKRRVATLRQCEEKSKEEMNYKTDESKQGRGISTMGDDDDGESEEVGSGSEGESLGGFIVESSESDSSNSSNQSGNDSDDDVNFDDILSKLKRSKNPKLEWELEADMLSAFGVLSWPSF